MITWSEMGQQTTQAEKTYHLNLLNYAQVITLAD